MPGQAAAVKKCSAMLPLHIHNHKIVFLDLASRSYLKSNAKEDMEPAGRAQQMTTTSCPERNAITSRKRCS